MAYTLLQLINQVSGELGLASSNTAVIGNASNQVTQLLALAQRLGKDLVRDYEWQRLVRAKIMQTTAATTVTGDITSGSAVIASITATGLDAPMVVTGTGIAPYAQVLSANTAGSTVTLDTPVTTSTSAVSLTFAKQDYDLPDDYSRMVSDTNWDRTNHWRNLGTKTSQEWQLLQGGVISIGPRERYRIYNNRLRIFQALTTVYNFSFEYVSNYWVMATGETAGSKAAFSADTDTCVFPDELMCAGLKYYFLKAKKLDYAVEMAEYDDLLAKCKAGDVPAPALSLAPNPVPPYVGPWSVQDGNWPTS